MTEPGQAQACETSGNGKVMDREFGEAAVQMGEVAYLVACAARKYDSVLWVPKTYATR